jgi:hypothetical protein
MSESNKYYYSVRLKTKHAYRRETGGLLGAAFFSFFEEDLVCFLKMNEKRLIE